MFGFVFGGRDVQFVVEYVVEGVWCIFQGMGDVCYWMVIDQCGGGGCQLYLLLLVGEVYVQVVLEQV